jgi:hypothetical protein
MFQKLLKALGAELLREVALGLKQTVKRIFNRKKQPDERTDNLTENN